jgi:hypothetical protein
MRQTILFLSLLLLLPPADLTAKEFPLIAPGARVRVTFRSWDGFTQKGMVAALKPDTLLLDIEGRDAPLPVPLTSVKKLDLSLKPSNRGARALRGAAIGVAFGTILGVTLPAFPLLWGNDLQGKHIVLGSAVGMGCLLAGIEAASGREQWQEVSLPDRRDLSLHPQSGMRFALTFSF